MSFAKKTNAPIKIAAKIVQQKDAKAQHAKTQKLQIVVQQKKNAKRNVKKESAVLLARQKVQKTDLAAAKNTKLSLYTYEKGLF
ncbi:MAG: hypothetical protein JNM96_08870 [Bacteroidia bacterium]|nr:hypothetical protein [Bacteroidia bacterium]